MSRDDATVLDIANAARLIQTFIQGMTRETFLGDLKTQSAVLRQVTVIGEAVKRLSQAFRARHPILPWSSMAGMRDHLIQESLASRAGAYMTIPWRRAPGAGARHAAQAGVE